MVAPAILNKRSLSSRDEKFSGDQAPSLHTDFSSRRVWGRVGFESASASRLELVREQRQLLLCVLGSRGYKRKQREFKIYKFSLLSDRYKNSLEWLHSSSCWKEAG